MSMNSKSSLRSDIQGRGHGDAHNWQHEGTSPSRTTYYKCRACGHKFGHHYPSEPSIFKAMFFDGVPAECKATGETA